MLNVYYCIATLRWWSRHANTDAPDWRCVSLGASELASPSHTDWISVCWGEWKNSSYSPAFLWKYNSIVMCVSTSILLSVLGSNVGESSEDLHSPYWAPAELPGKSPSKTLPIGESTLGGSYLILIFSHLCVWPELYLFFYPQID